MVLEKLVRFFSSLRLTVVCLTLALILVFWGTIAQVELGLYRVQHEFFQSVLVVQKFNLNGVTIPVVFPGGYLLGTVLLLNLTAAYMRRFSFSKQKAGLLMIHGGLMLLLVGQLLTDKLSRESMLHLREGQAKNYTEANTATELAIVDVTDTDSDKVIAIPQSKLRSETKIQHESLPFTLNVQRWYANSQVAERRGSSEAPIPASQGFGPRLIVEERPQVTAMDSRDIPSAIIELLGTSGSLGTWAVSGYIEQPQTVAYNGRTYELTLRRVRYYKPYTIHLLDFRHDVYPGTQIPKNFSSRVRVHHAQTGEDREVLIYMNNPLRYEGETFYQASFDTDNEGTILQVVRNPSWLAPYASTVLVSLGLLVQFMTHMIGFVKKRRTV